MDIDQFNSMVARLERESADDPRRYRRRVALLALLGFCILALVVAVIGFGLVVLGGVALGLVLVGGKAFLLVLKLGKLLFLLAIPLWYTLKSAVRALFVRLPVPAGRPVTAAEAPALFAALARMRTAMDGPRFHHVLVVNDLNAAVVQRPAFGLFGWPRNYLLLGLPLLDVLAPAEALAVVAHEYGHLAGAHGRFSAFIYRLRHTWSAVHAHMEHFQGWLARGVAPLVRWYAPYFNAYTYVLARADEYRADAASAELAGARDAAHALKRVNLAGPRFARFMDATYARAHDEPAPPADLLRRWAAEAGAAPAPDDLQRWLDAALDREGHFADTHPTLRARLGALAGGAGTAGPLSDEAGQLPPAVSGESAGQAWFGAALDTLRDELGAGWAAGVRDEWQARHAAVQAQRARLDTLRALDQRTLDEDLELFNLARQVEPGVDLRAPLAAFNAAHPDEALGLYLEGIARLAHDERAGIDLLERAMACDPDATCAACERAHAWLAGHGDDELAAAYAERWRTRRALEAERDVLEGRAPA